jgi:hypothetical protein
MIPVSISLIHIENVCLHFAVLNTLCSGSCLLDSEVAMTLPRQLPIHGFCSVIVLMLGQILPETATLFQLLLCGFAAFYRILPIMQPRAIKRERRRKQRSVAYHACRYRPCGWQHFYRSAWPIRLRLQSDGCVYCSLWLRTLECTRESRSVVPTATTLFERVIRWFSDGLGYLFDRTRGHPGEGPHEHDNVCVRVCVRCVM